MEVPLHKPQGRWLDSLNGIQSPDRKGHSEPLHRLRYAGLTKSNKYYMSSVRVYSLCYRHKATGMDTV